MAADQPCKSLPLHSIVDIVIIQRTSDILGFLHVLQILCTFQDYNPLTCIYIYKSTTVLSLWFVQFDQNLSVHIRFNTKGFPNFKKTLSVSRAHSTFNQDRLKTPGKSPKNVCVCKGHMVGEIINNTVKNWRKFVSLSNQINVALIN